MKAQCRLKGFQTALCFQASGKKQLVRGILRFLVIAVSQTFQETVKCGGIVRRHIDTDQNPPVIRTVVAVMEERNVPTALHMVQKTRQRPRTLRKLKTDQTLVFYFVRPPSDI